MTVRAPHAMVAAPDHLASQAGLRLLHQGGTAADAAVAASAVLAVTCPHMCGLGGDLWALVHTPGNHRAERPTPDALDSSGRAGSGADPDRLHAEGHDRMPVEGDVRAVPVPGCVDGWLALHQRHGRRPLADVLSPAVELARDGFPASPLLAGLIPWARAHIPGAADDLRTGDRQTGDQPNGGTPRAGARVRRPDLAATLDAVATGGRDAFYRGPFGDGLLTLGQGEYVATDLDTPLARWVTPLDLDVWGHTLWTVPPPSQGYLTLANAWIAERLDLPDDPDDGLWAHLLVEACRAAGHDRLDVLHEHAEGHALLTPDRLAPRAAAIDPQRRATWPDPSPNHGDTIYLCAVDEERRAVSLIQSNTGGFGSNLAVAGTGAFLQNRGIGFSLEPGHPAEYGPGRRPPSTLSPALVTRPDGSLRATVGTMGGDSQPQVLLQVLARLLHHGHSPGRAIGAPRFVLTHPDARGFDTWHAGDGIAVRIEADAPAAWNDGLAARGHRVQAAPRLDMACGHAQLIAVDDENLLAGAADPRAMVGGVASS